MVSLWVGVTVGCCHHRSVPWAALWRSGCFWGVMPPCSGSRSWDRCLCPDWAGGSGDEQLPPPIALRREPEIPAVLHLQSYRSKTDSNYSIMSKFRNREHHGGLPGLFRAPADEPWGSLWACARRVRTIRDLKLEFFAPSCPCKPWSMVQGPWGCCRPPVEAPHLFCHGLMALSRARPRRAGAVTAAAVPRHPPCPLPGAGSGIGLGYYSNAAFLPN